MNQWTDIHPLTASLDLSLGPQFLQQVEVLFASSSLFSGPNSFLLLTSIVECTLQGFDVILKCGQDITFAQCLEFIVSLDLVIGFNDRLCFGPACVRLEIKGVENVDQLVHGNLPSRRFMFHVSFLKLKDVLIEKLTPLILIVGRAERGLTLDDRPNGLPTTIVLDFRMPL